jgi:hypothetical protein
MHSMYVILGKEYIKTGTNGTLFSTAEISFSV